MKTVFSREPQSATTVEMDIGTFADIHGLWLTVTERSNPTSRRDRYFAAFECCKIVDGRLLVSAFGNGASITSAISNYARRISGKVLHVRRLTTFGEFAIIPAGRLTGLKSTAKNANE